MVHKLIRKHKKKVRGLKSLDYSRKLSSVISRSIKEQKMFNEDIRKSSIIRKKKIRVAKAIIKNQRGKFNEMLKGGLE